DRVLQAHHPVGALYQRSELRADFILSGSGDFMVMYFNHDSHLLQRRAYCRTNVLQRVYRWDGKVAAFDRGTMSLVTTVKRIPGGPGCFLREDLVAGARHVDLPFHGIENKELGLGTEERGVT